MSRIPDFTDVPLGDLWSLTGKVAVITGGGSGMGQATAVRFAEAGATVVVADIAPDHATETLAMIDERTPTAVTDSIHVDITDPDQVRALGDTVTERHGGIDIWVNTAFVQSSSAIVDYPDEEWRRGIAINLDGAFYCAREAARHMIAGERRGVIILVTSGSAHHGRARRYQYVAAKHGTLGLVRSLALELGPHGIRAVAIAPAATDTPGFRGGREKYQRCRCRRGRQATRRNDRQDGPRPPRQGRRHRPCRALRGQRHGRLRHRQHHPRRRRRRRRIALQARRVRNEEPSMQFTLQYPMPHPPSPDFLRPSTIIRVAQAAEAAGFSAIAFTEHPAPPHQWLTSGGHEAFDPLVALAFCAGTTSRLRLMPFVLVLPYHQPFLLAKSAASLDVLSEGRLTVVGGAGYLKSEFGALGVDFDRRNDLVEQAIAAMRAAWTTDELELSGFDFRVRAMTARPRPVQDGGPPIWLGGNSALTRRRVGTLADGWSPNMYDEGSPSLPRTPPMSSLADVAAGIREIASIRAEHGRSPAFDVQLLGPHGRQPPSKHDVAAHLDLLGDAAEAGVTWSVLQLPHRTVEEALDVIASYGTDVIVPSAGN